MPAYRLGELESEIMEILWAQKTCTVQQVLQQLREKRQIAYTTVATVLNRLYEKKIVVKKANKNFHSFSPAISKDAYSTSMVQRFMTDFMNIFGDSAIPSFAGGINSLKEEDRRKLVKLLETDDKK